MQNLIQTPGDGFQLQGTIVTRVYKGDFPEEEYHRLHKGPDRQRQPDMFTNDGVPVYILSEFEQRWTQRELDKLCIDQFITKNVACNAGRTNILNYIGNTIDQGVRYFSVGTGVGVPAATDTAMFNDFFRKSPTTVTVVGNQVLIGTSFTTSEGNTTYTEAGLIGGSTAVVTPGGAGTLFAHALYSYTKTSSVSLTNDYYMAMN